MSKASENYTNRCNTLMKNILLYIFSISFILYGCNEDIKIITQLENNSPIIRTDSIDISNWRKLSHIKNRIATQNDVNKGDAIFQIIPKGKKHIALNIQIPSLAYLINLENKTKILVVVTQAEKAGNETVIGIKYLDGSIGACTLEELEFIKESEIENR